MRYDPSSLQKTIALLNSASAGMTEIRWISAPGRDFEAVLALREKGYRSRGKIPPPPTDLYHPGFILLGFFAQDHRCLASVTLGTQGWSFEADLLGRTKKQLAPLPPSEDSLEVLRLCVADHPSKPKLVLQVFETVYALFRSMDRKHLVVCADPRLELKYLCMGFKRTRIQIPGKRYPLRVLKGTDRAWWLAPFVIGITRWSMLVRASLKILPQGGLTRLSWIERALLKIADFTLDAGQTSQEIVTPFFRQAPKYAGIKMIVMLVMALWFFRETV